MRTITLQHLGMCPYLSTWQAMKAFTDNRDEQSADALWLLSHPPVFTQGKAGKPEHLLKQSHIPVIHTDRGGQITYHGPGQLIAYPLLNIDRLEKNTRALVTALENTLINTLKSIGIPSYSKPHAPGIYTDTGKIASIGLRVRKGCCYHGIALNVDMDLTPFDHINPCGYSNLAMDQISAYQPTLSMEDIEQQFITEFCQEFGYNTVQHQPA